MLELPWTPLYTQSGGSDSSAGNDSDGSDALIARYALAATIGFTVCLYTLESWLDRRQWHAYSSEHSFPPLLASTIQKVDKDQTILKKLKDKFSKAQEYGRDKMFLGMLASFYETVEACSFLLLGFLPYCWDASVKIGADYFEWDSAHEIKISLIFLGLLTAVSTVTGLPFEIYSTFGVEKKHGFNQQTVKLFVTDKIQSLLLTAAIGSPVVALLLTIIQSSGEFWYLYAWAFMFVFSVAMMSIVPIFIMPIFNKYEPLEDGPLKTNIYKLADRLEYPLTKLFVMDGSKRSSHSNAFMFGFGRNKRIVLFDTLLTQVTESEILAILGHELGHWKLGHTLSNFVVTQVYTGAAFYGFAQVLDNRALFSAFGFDDTSAKIPTLIALLLFFQSLWAPVDKILSLVLTLVSRHKEFAADEFGASLGYTKELQTGLCKIHLENLGAMRPDPYYSTYHYSHPPLVERLAALEQYIGEKKKQ